jgi:transcriptional regulator with XRE-family HTH domain
VAPKQPPREGRKRVTTHFSALCCDEEVAAASGKKNSERDVSEKACLDAGQSAVSPLLTNRIRYLRREREWTLRKLSEISGISMNALWRMEKGGLPMLPRAFQIAKAFQLTIYDLWDVPAPVGCAPSYVALLPNTLKIRALRDAQGWQLADLAKLTCIPKSTLSQIERGALPSLKNAVRIAAALGASVDELWGGLGCQSSCTMPS